MPRTISGIYSPPAGTKGISQEVISSTAYNAFVDDLTNDANAARPVSAGGTGAATASDARDELGLTIGTDVQAYDADTAKLDVAQTWTAVQKFDGSNGLRTKSANVGAGPSYVRFEDSAATSLGSVGAGSGLTDDISLNATSGDLILNCASGTAFLNSNPIASVYTGSSAANTSFPIGTCLEVNEVTTPTNRNASAVVRNNGSNNWSFVTGSGTALSGTWRARGSAGLGGSAYLTTFERTA